MIRVGVFSQMTRVCKTKSLWHQSDVIASFGRNNGLLLRTVSAGNYPYVMNARWYIVMLPFDLSCSSRLTYILCPIATLWWPRDNLHAAVFAVKLTVANFVTTDDSPQVFLTTTCATTNDDKVGIFATRVFWRSEIAVWCLFNEGNKRCI